MRSRCRSGSCPHRCWLHPPGGSALPARSRCQSERGANRRFSLSACVRRVASCSSCVSPCLRVGRRFRSHAPVAAVRRRLTAAGGHFMKRPCAGKNERFDSTQRARGEIRPAGRSTQSFRPALCRTAPCYFRLLAKVCVNAQPTGDLLTKSRISSQMAYGVRPYRLMLNGIFTADRMFTIPSLPVELNHHNELHRVSHSSRFPYRRPSHSRPSMNAKGSSAGQKKMTTRSLISHVAARYCAPAALRTRAMT